MIAFSAIRESIRLYPGGGEATDEPFAIYVIRPDGTDLRRLTDERLDWCIGPCWSPDGRRLAFTSHDRRARVQRPYVINADGTELGRLLPEESLLLSDSRADVFVIDWRADGRVVFTVRREINVGAYVADVYIIEADGSTVARLPSDLDLIYLDLSPDGTQLLVAWKQHWSSEPVRAPEVNWLYVVRRDGSGLRPLIRDDPQYGHAWAEPMWSPDGRRIVYRANDDEQEISLYVMDADGSHPRRLGQTWFEFAPYWSPDSRFIAHIVHRDGRYVLDIADIESGVTRELAALTEGDESGEVVPAMPAWSPDSTELIFSSLETDGRFYIYGIRPDGSDRRPVTSRTSRFDLLCDLAWGRDP